MQGVISLTVCLFPYAGCDFSDLVVFVFVSHAGCEWGPDGADARRHSTQSHADAGGQCACIASFINLHTHTHKCTHKMQADTHSDNTRPHTHISTYTCPHTHVHTHRHIHTDTQTHTHTHTVIINNEVIKTHLFRKAYCYCTCVTKVLSKVVSIVCVAWCECVCVAWCECVCVCVCVHLCLCMRSCSMYSFVVCAF